jgi:eukaryotic-like serine/threonine-protein kinase
MATTLVPLSARMLRDHLKQDVATREASIARFMCAMTGFSACAALALMSVIGRSIAFGIATLTGVLCVYYFVTFRLLRSGWFHPILQWLNTAVMVSIPAAVFVIDHRFRGAVYALTTPPMVAWGALIVVSALRATPVLAMAGGALAALEYFGLYLFLARPEMPADAPATLTAPLIAVRAVFLFCYGPLTAILARHLVRKAEEALRAVRERDVMGKYLLHERIGAGGMAEVFRATYSPEGGFERTVAVKRILPAYSASRDFLTMFRREAELCAMLNHPNIVQVLDLGRHQGTFFLVMEHVDGCSLETLLERLSTHRLPPSAVAYLGAEMAGALDYVHTRVSHSGEPLALVHRDVNPPNMLLSRIGEVKLSDFGIARAATHASLTMHGGVRGKAGYMSPEQAMSKPIDGRTDLYALGLTLHEALTGQRALQGGSVDALMQAAAFQTVAAPSTLVPGVPPELDAVILGLVQPDLERRTPSAGELRRQLLTLTGIARPYPARTPTGGSRWPRPSRKTRPRRRRSSSPRTWRSPRCSSRALPPPGGRGVNPALDRASPVRRAQRHRRRALDLERLHVRPPRTHRGHDVPGGLPEALGLEGDRGGQEPVLELLSPRVEDHAERLRARGRANVERPAILARRRRPGRDAQHLHAVDARLQLEEPLGEWSRRVALSLQVVRAQPGVRGHSLHRLVRLRGRRDEVRVIAARARRGDVRLPAVAHPSAPEDQVERLARLEGIALIHLEQHALLGRRPVDRQAHLARVAGPHLRHIRPLDLVQRGRDQREHPDEGRDPRKSERRLRPREVS